jgi:hypothetical protein
VQSHYLAAVSITTVSSFLLVMPNRRLSIVPFQNSPRLPKPRPFRCSPLTPQHRQQPECGARIMVLRQPDSMRNSSSSDCAPAPIRRRRANPKTRTGCITCKYVAQLGSCSSSQIQTAALIFIPPQCAYIVHRIRRIKCDEGKPSCFRCTSTGRKCDGYLPIPATKAQTMGRMKTATYIPSPPSSDHQDHQDHV